MSSFKVEYIYDGFAPCDKAFMFIFFTYISFPYLFSKSFRYRCFLHLKKVLYYLYISIQILPLAYKYLYSI